MDSSLVQQIRKALAANRGRADEVLRSAAEQARPPEAGADSEALRRAEQRLAEIERLRESIKRHSERIESGYVEMVEALASASMRLVEISRSDDFSPPPWPGGIERTVELKLSETREMTVRFGLGREQGRDR